MKKKLLVSVALVAIVAVVLTCSLVGCKKPDQGPNGLNSNKVFTSKSDLLTVSAVSVGNMMGSYNGGIVSVAAEIPTESADPAPADPAPADPAPVAPVDPTIEKINYYMSVVDGILGKEVSSTTTDIAADDPEYGGKYAKKCVISTGKDATLKEYVMIYNETKLVENDVEKTAKEEEDTETETEEEFKIEGILIVDGVQYVFDGARELETETEEGEEPETEAEFKFTAYVTSVDAEGNLVKDMNNYINFKQEIEQEGNEVEQEFFYEVFKDGKSVKTFSLEVEKDPVDNELEVELVDGGLTLKFASEVKKGEEFIEIYALEGGKAFTVEAKVTVDENGDKVFTYSQAGKDDISLKDDFDDED